jgi:WD40 repeat protein
MRLASLDRDGLLLVHDTAQHTALLAIEAGDVDKIAWSRGGSYLAGLNTDSGFVEVWDDSGDAIFTSTPTYLPQYGADFDWKDDRYLLRWVWGEFTTTDVWDAASGRVIGHPDAGQAGDLAYSPDGHFLAAGRCIYNAGCTEIGFLASWQTTVVEWSPDSQWLAIGSWNHGTSAKAPAWIINANTGDMARELGEFHRVVTQIAWSKDGSKLLVMDSANELTMWDPHSGQLLARSTAHTQVGNIAAWRTDGSMIAAPNTIESANVWDTSTGSLIAALGGHHQPVTELDWQPGGSLLATRGGDWFQSADTDLRVWDSNQNSRLIAVIPHDTMIADVAWSPDGTILASAVRGNTISLWNAQSQQLEPPITTLETETLLGIQWSAQRDIISTSQISSGNGGFVALWDVDSGNRIQGGFPRTASDWVWTREGQLVWTNWGHYVHGGVPAAYLRRYGWNWL